MVLKSKNQQETPDIAKKPYRAPAMTTGGLAVPNLYTCTPPNVDCGYACLPPNSSC